MSEPKFYWKGEALYHSKYLFSKATNILEGYREILSDMKEKLNALLNKNGLSLYTGNILLFENENEASSGFASPFLNLININSRIIKGKEKEDLLWLILHENLHIMEADIISQGKIQANPKIQYFNGILEKWLSESLDLEIEIYYKDAEDFYNCVWDNLEYEPLNLMKTFSNLLKIGEEEYIFPTTNENLKYIFNRYSKLLNGSSIKLGDGDLNSMRGKVVSTYLLNCTLHASLLEIYRKISEPKITLYQILPDARIIYFSSIILEREIDDYLELFPIDECKLFEANRLKEKYGAKFNIGNYIKSICNERLSDEAINIAFKSIFRGI